MTRGGGFRGGFAVLAVLFGVLVGCGPSGASSGAGPTRLYVVLGGEPASRDPLAAFDELSDVVLANVYQAVLAPEAPEGYSACRAWTNPDLRTWDLQVRPGLRFHDGRPLAAADVAASIEAVVEDSSGGLSPFLNGVERVQATGPLNVRIRTAEPVNLLAGLSFVPVLPGGRRPTAEDLPVGSGPYRVVSWETGRRIVLRRFLQAGERPGAEPQEVVVTSASSVEDQLRLLASLSPVIGTSLLRPVRKEADSHGLEVVSAPGTGAWYLVCNLESGHPAADPGIRRALAASFDAAAFARELGIPDLRPADDLVAPGVVGWRRGRFQPVPSWDTGARPEVPLKMVAMKTVEGAASAVAGQLEARGWRVEAEILPVKEALAALRGEGWDLSLLGFRCGTGDALELYEFAFMPEQGPGGGNFSHYQDPEVAALITGARRALDPAARLGVLQRIGDALIRDLPWIPLVVTDRWAVTHGPVQLHRGIPPRWWLTQVELRR